MNPGRNRWLFRLAILLVAGIAFYLWAVQGRSQEVTIENRSNQRISQLTITIAGQTSTFKGIKAGSQASAPLRFHSEDRFEVEGQLEDGTTIRSRGVIGERTHFIVLPGGELQFRPAGQK
jgi:hypothetical protein